MIMPVCRAQVAAPRLVIMGKWSLEQPVTHDHTGLHRVPQQHRVLDEEVQQREVGSPGRLSDRGFGPWNRAAPGQVIPAGASAHDPDVLRLGPLRALRDVELALLPLLKAAVAAAGDRAEMHETVRTALDSDEAVALVAVEPFHRALRHLDLLRSGPSPRHQAGACPPAIAPGQPVIPQPAHVHRAAPQGVRCGQDNPTGPAVKSLAPHRLRAEPRIRMNATMVSGSSVIASRIITRSRTRSAGHRRPRRDLCSPPGYYRIGGPDLVDRCHPLGPPVLALAWPARP